MSSRRTPATDFGTVLIHWLLVAAFIVLVATGLKLAADEPSLFILKYLDSILPQEDLWYLHLLSAIGLTALFIAYGFYISRARLGQRIRLDRARISGLFRSARLRWAAVNVLLYWVFFLALSVEIVTGAMLFFGIGGGVLTLHLHSMWLCLAFPILHVAAHWSYGGNGQLLRIVRPAKNALPQPAPDLVEILVDRLEQLEQNGSESSEPAETAPPLGRSSIASTLFTAPLVIAAATVLVVAACSFMLERASRNTLVIHRIPRSQAPVLDGDLADPAWRDAPMVSVLTKHGANFGGTGESLVEIRAVHDEEYVYFAFTWTDPTRSLKHLPLIKFPDGWHVVQTDDDTAEENSFHEDKFAVLFAPPGRPLIGKAIHLGQQPKAGIPGSVSGRGLHYTDGGIVDVWEWRASHGGLIGFVDNDHFGAPKQPNQAQLASRQRYTGGFARDPDDRTYIDNFEPDSDTTYSGIVRPRCFPKNLARTMAVMALLDAQAEHSEPEGSRLWMTLDDSVPYSETLDNSIPVGTVIPGVILLKSKPGPMEPIHGVARWAGGRWSLEVARRLDTGSAFDIPIKTGVLMWVAAFDHSETRHTYHLRPFRLEVE